MMTSAFFFCGSMYASKSGLRASMDALMDSSLWPRSAMSRCNHEQQCDWQCGGFANDMVMAGSGAVKI